MKSSKKLVFFGNERLSSGFDASQAPVLRSLLGAGYEIAAIVSHYEAGRSRTNRLLEVEAIAREHSIPLLLPDKPIEVIEQLASYQAEAAVLVAYGRIVSQSVIDLFPHGILNLHPSLLPLYRGPTPIEQAILDGASKTGISIMQLVKAMDAGPLYGQAEVPLTGTEEKFALTKTLLDKGAQLLIDLLPDILAGKITPTAQDDSQATYCSLLQKSDGRLDTATKTAVHLEREVRAYAVYPKSHLNLFGHTCIITKAKVVETRADSPLVVDCAHNTLLAIEQLIAPSGKYMSGAAFLHGYGR